MYGSVEKELYYKKKSFCTNKRALQKKELFCKKKGSFSPSFISNCAIWSDFGGHKILGFFN